MKRSANVFDVAGDNDAKNRALSIMEEIVRFSHRTYSSDREFSSPCVKDMGMVPPSINLLDPDSDGTNAVSKIGKLSNLRLHVYTTKNGRHRLSISGNSETVLLVTEKLRVAMQEEPNTVEVCERISRELSESESSSVAVKSAVSVLSDVPNGSKHSWEIVEAPRSDNCCVCCKTGQRRIVLMPCAHLAFCQDCDDAFSRNDAKCPMCKTSIVHRLKIYLK